MKAASSTSGAQTGRGTSTTSSETYQIAGKINRRSSRFAQWKRAFNSDTVPLVTPSPCLATVPGHPGARVYYLAWQQLPAPARERLFDYLSRKFGTPRDQVEHLLRIEGLPILADDVKVRSNKISPTSSPTRG
jgi:hypothetical protein